MKFKIKKDEKSRALELNVIERDGMYVLSFVDERGKKADLSCYDVVVVNRYDDNNVLISDMGATLPQDVKCFEVAIPCTDAPWLLPQLERLLCTPNVHTIQLLNQGD